jgi:16S rRNA (guanine(966)-N(2))-methyltransferase RsmD
MRLTGGLDRGRKLKAPQGLRTRPTSAKVREAIFNILGPTDSPVLDLFAGTGALGLESLSRGAPLAFFVERDGRALGALRRNIKAADLVARTTVIGRDVRQALRFLEAQPLRFGWVFVDPPYAAGLVEPTLLALGRCTGSSSEPAVRPLDPLREAEPVSSGILAPGGVVIVEHDKRHLPPEACGDLVMTDRRFYGDTGVSFFRCHGRLS